MRYIIILYILYYVYMYGKFVPTDRDWSIHTQVLWQRQLQQHKDLKRTCKGPSSGMKGENTYHIYNIYNVYIYTYLM